MVPNSNSNTSECPEMNTSVTRSILVLSRRIKNWDVASTSGHNAVTSEFRFRFRFRNASEGQKKGHFRLFQISTNRRFDFIDVFYGVDLAKLDCFHEDDVTCDVKLEVRCGRSFRGKIDN